ncbi:MAG: response regulator [Gemmatimonadetes bacterium]|nr:response regulator [Gemmatimonadota bacterium]
MPSSPSRPGAAALAVRRADAAPRRQVMLAGALSVGIVAILLVIAAIGFETLSAARAYVGGEGQWSKAQKDAVRHLMRYAWDGDSLHYAAYQRELEVYRGDHVARVELLRPAPDWEVVHAGFLRGRNHPDDVHRMGVFLRRYGRVPFVAEAVRSWSAGDSLMVQLEALGARLGAERGRAPLPPASRDAFLMELDALARELALLENAFSDTMGAGARWAARWLLVALAGVAVILLAIGGVTFTAAWRRILLAEAARRAIEAQLRQAQKMEAVGQLTGGIAHDFNNLLTVILSNVRLLEDGLPAGYPDLKDDLDELKVAAQRGADMIRKLLAFSRAGQVSFETRTLAEVLPEAVQMLRRVLPATVAIDAELDAAVPAVRTDPSAVQQMVLNLATNARDAMPGGGTLRLRLGRASIGRDFIVRRGWGREGSYVALSVSDTGAGMPPAVLDRAFEPFFTTKPPGQGSGLGLAMVYGLMKQHGGFVDVASTPEQGTTVTLFFPVAEEPAIHPPPVAPVTIAGGGTILLVEDEPALRRAAQRLLERSGFRVLSAADGQEGLELARVHRDALDLVLSDVVMPRMGGPALHAALAREGIVLPFLFTSGYTGREMPDGIPLPPDVPLLPKPWDAQELVAWVARAMGR